MKPPWDGGMKVYSNGPGHMTIWPPRPYIAKTSGTKGLMTLKVGVQHWVLEYYQVCSNNDPGLTLI